MCAQRKPAVKDAKRQVPARRLGRGPGRSRHGIGVMSLLTSQTESLVSTGFGTLPRVNLLPPEIGEARRFRRIQYGLGGGLALSAGVVALLYVAAAGSARAGAPRHDRPGDAAADAGAGDRLRVADPRRGSSHAAHHA